MSGVNIASYLVEMARRQSGTDALLTNAKRDSERNLTYVHTTFQELNERTDALARGMAGLGVAAGTRVALCLRPGVEFFAVTFALFKLGAVPVLIDPGIGVRNFGRCLAQARPEVFVGVPLAHLLRRALGWAKGSIRATITTGGFGGISLQKIATGAERGNTVEANTQTGAAAILFTSGSTGPAKGVLYTHDNFNAQIEALKQTYRIEPGEIDLATFPLFALFGPALGMTTVLPEMNFTRPGFVDPRNIIEPIRHYEYVWVAGADRAGEQVWRGAGREAAVVAAGDFGGGAGVGTGAGAVFENAGGGGGDFYAVWGDGGAAGRFHWEPGDFGGDAGADGQGDGGLRGAAGEQYSRADRRHYRQGDCWMVGRN